MWEVDRPYRDPGTDTPRLLTVRDNYGLPVSLNDLMSIGGANGSRRKSRRISHLFHARLLKERS